MPDKTDERIAAVWVTAERQNMANPQKENGYTPIANEIMEALAKTRIPGEARQVLDVIIRKTYGFNKAEDLISLSQFVRATGLKRPNVVRAIQKLLEMNIIRRKYKQYQKRYSGIGNDTPVSKVIPATGGSYELNKNYEKWQPSIKSDTPVSKVIITPVSKAIHTKDNITKDNNTPSLFEKSEPVATKKNEKPKLNGWASWVDVNREYGRPDPAPVGPDLKAAKIIAVNALDRNDLENLFRMFLSDSDAFLAKQGHALRLMPGRINKYINVIEQQPAGFGSTDYEREIIEEIERKVTKQ